MKVLITGSGGREHALAWRISQADSVSRVYVAPGNAGTALEHKVENLPIAADDFDGLAGFAGDADIDLTIVGPEAPLVAGFTDHFEQLGLACFGPSRDAARLEGSKAFAKAFLQRHGIPTAASETFADLGAANAYVRQRLSMGAAPVVIKADGLAAGKGVILAHSEEEAHDALASMLSGEAFGGAGRRVVIEEFLAGEEASFIALCDGQTALPLASSQDHKAAFDGDQGPNTGGMGAYSPAPVVDARAHRRIMDEVIRPTLAGMAAEGAPFVGFLYAGLMMSEDGAPRVIEFNCRLGDPEAQPLLLRLRSDLAAACLAALRGRLHEVRLDWDERAALGVVMAADGYPGPVASGQVIRGLDQAQDGNCKVFHAGARIKGSDVVTSGGRVLCVTALGADVREARQRAYAGVAGIDWGSQRFRTDIGYRALR